jgi:uncharacterized protein (TIGR03437 family)
VTRAGENFIYSSNQTAQTFLCLLAGGAMCVPPLAAQPGGTPPAATAIAPAFSNLDYAGTGNPRQMLDLWVPAGDGPFPLIVWIHGGAFRVGSKASPPPFPDRLMPRGFAFASIGYRLSAEAQWPAQIQDAKAAIRFLRAHAARYKLDANRFGVVGASAGGHLAAMLGTSGETTIWDTATMPNAGVSSRVQAVVDQFGPIDFSQMDAMQLPSCAAGTTNAATSPESQLLGCAVGACADKVREASPLTYVSASTPPFLIAHGSNDCNISPEQSRLLAETLTRAGGRPIFRVLPGAGHGGAQFDHAAYVTMLDGFFLRALQAANPSTADAAEFQSAVVAPGQLVSLFGSRLADGSATAGAQPWPMSLNGVSVMVQDAAGVSRNAGMVFVSPGQVNAQLPGNLPAGPATISVIRGGATALQDRIQVIGAAPTLFVQTVENIARPLGDIVWTGASGLQQRAPLLSADASGRWTVGRLRFSQAAGAITLVLYGTGLNSANAAAAARVSDVEASVRYAGAQGQFAGLDQYNIEIPRSLAGRGDVTLSISINGMPATAVRLSIE